MKTLIAPPDTETAAPLYKHGLPSPAILKHNRAEAIRLRSEVRIPGTKAAKQEIPVRNGRTGNILAKLKESGKKVETLGIRASVKEDYQEWLAASLAYLDDEEAMTEHHELLARAAQGSEEARFECAAAVKDIVVKLLIPEATWTHFFMGITLAEDETPIIRTHVEQETGIRVIGQDGVPKDFGAVQNIGNQLVDLFILTTDWFRYKLSDIYYGSSVKDTALATFDMARDMALQIDKLIRSYHLVGASGSIATAAFTTTGPDHLRHYLVHSSVATGNLPTGNVITLVAGQTATSKPRLALLRAIIQYCTSFGSNSFRDGDDLVPVAIHVPSSDAVYFLDEVAIEGNTDQQREELRNNPFQINFGGYVFTIVPDATLDPAGKTAYVRMNRPTGLVYTKPSHPMTMTVVDDRILLKVQNEERRLQSQIVGFGLPTSWAVNFLAVVYAT